MRLRRLEIEILYYLLQTQDLSSHMHSTFYFRYPEDAALSYEELPTDPGWEGASIIVGTGEEQRLLNLESSRYYVGRAKSFWADLKEHQKDILQGICDNIPRVIGVPVIGIVPNPIYYICLAIKTLKSTVLWIVYIGLVAA